MNNVQEVEFSNSSELDLIETLHLGFFGMTDYNFLKGFHKFNMTDPIWPTKNFVAFYFVLSWCLEVSTSVDDETVKSI